MKNEKLDEMIKELGYRMPAEEFVKTYKIYGATKGKLYDGLRKNKLPTYREWKREEDRFDAEIIAKAKEEINKVRNKKGSWLDEPFEEVFTHKPRINFRRIFSEYRYILTYLTFRNLNYFLKVQTLEGFNEQDI